jgi:hypothetical protein
MMMMMTLNAYFGVVYFLKINEGNTESSAHSAEGGVTATALGTHL